MTNTLGAYNPIFYANEALIHLEKALGMAGRVHRGYDAERQSVNKGETIRIRKPAVLTAQDAPGSAEDLATVTEDISMDYYREVRIGLTDKDMALSDEAIITEHIRPAAYALANDIDTKLNELYADVPWYDDAQGSSSLLDLTAPYQTLFDNAVPMMPGYLHFEVGGTQQAYFQQLSLFNDASVRGTPGPTETTRAGSLGTAMGFEVFGNQNVQTHTKGTLNVATTALVGAHAADATSVTMDATTLTGTVTEGDTFVIAGNSLTVPITPKLAAAYDNNAVVTLSLDNHTANLAFHRNAFAFASAPLPMKLQNELGAKATTLIDPITGLSRRSRLFYDGDNTYMVLDILYGVKTLDPNLATRLRG